MPITLLPIMINWAIGKFSLYDVIANLLRSKQIRLQSHVVNELKLSSDIDPALSYKDADEEYVAKLDPDQRDILFKGKAIFAFYESFRGQKVLPS